MRPCVFSLWRACIPKHFRKLSRKRENNQGFIAATTTHLQKKSKETLAKILSECPVKGWSVARDKESDLSRAVLMGIRSITAGNLHEGNDALMREIKAEGRARLIRRGKSGKNMVDRSKIAAVVRADRDSR